MYIYTRTWYRRHQTIGMLLIAYYIMLCCCVAYARVYRALRVPGPIPMFRSNRCIPCAFSNLQMHSPPQWTKHFVYWTNCAKCQITIMNYRWRIAPDTKCTLHETPRFSVLFPPINNTYRETDNLFCLMARHFIAINMLYMEWMDRTGYYANQNISNYEPRPSIL